MNFFNSQSLLRIPLILQRRFSSGPNFPGKPCVEIPGPKGYPLIGNPFQVYRDSNAGKQMHLYFDKQHLRYGSIYREKLSPGFEAVFLNDPVDIEHLFRNEGRYPRRTTMTPWIEYRKQTNRPLGVLLGEGPTWQKSRSAVNTYMMKTAHVESHTLNLDHVAQDLLLRLDSVISNNGRIQDLQDFLYKWSFECAGVVLFNERIGCLSDPPPQKAIQFYRSIQTIQSTTMDLLALPMSVVKALNLKIWKDHCHAWDTLFKIGDEYCKYVISKMKNSSDSNNNNHGLIGHLIVDGKLNNDEILANVTDFLIAAVDTTCVSVCWILTLLAANPEQQMKLYEEIQNHIPKDGPIKSDNIKQMIYLKALVKETFRLKPVTYSLARILPDDLVLRDFLVPKDMTVQLSVGSVGLRESLFQCPGDFIPERWIRGNTASIHHPFSHLPFGFGPRACIGRRLAELEIYLAVCRILKRYEIKGTVPRARSTFILVPDDKIVLTFQPRRL